MREASPQIDNKGKKISTKDHEDTRRKTKGKMRFFATWRRGREQRPSNSSGLPLHCVGVVSAARTEPAFLTRGLHSSQECNLAQDFPLQRVLVTEGRSRNTIRGSMRALKRKRQARARPAQSVPARLQTKRRKMLKTSTFLPYAQRPGEKCGLVNLFIKNMLTDSENRCVLLLVSNPG